MGDYQSKKFEQTKKNGKKKSGGGGGIKTTVKLSTDPQSVAARERRHRISNRFKTLQSLVPGGAKLDTVSMLDEAIHYVKYLKSQIMFHHHQNIINFNIGYDDFDFGEFEDVLDLANDSNSSVSFVDCDQENAMFACSQPQKHQYQNEVIYGSSVQVPMGGTPSFEGFSNSSCGFSDVSTMYFDGYMQ